MFEETRNKHFKKFKKSVLSHIAVYSEDDGHKLVNFNEETMSFTCQVVKIGFSDPMRVESIKK